MNKCIKIEEEIKTLDKLEIELDELLSTIKPSDKLVIGDTFLLENDIPIPGKRKEAIKKDSIITIKNIFKGGKGKTDTIKYVIDLGNNIYSMSKGIFIVSFCKDIISKEDELSKKIKKLRSKIKEEENKIENKDVLRESNKVQKKVHILIDFIKSISKALKKG